MNRRRFLSAAGSSVAAGVFPSVSVPAVPLPHGSAVRTSRASSPATLTRPNIVLFVCDDLGWGDLSCYGAKLPTPNLDALAASGRRCTHYTSANSICSASRAAILTGQYPTRVGSPGVFTVSDTVGLDLSAPTLADVLRSGGYRTHAVGKWHLGRPEIYLPTSRGFDTFYGVPWSVDMSPFSLIVDTKVVEENTDKNTVTPRYTDRVLNLLNHRDEKPFFIYCAYSYPHIQLHASSRFRGKSGFGIYGDAVQEIDWSVGEIMRSLREKNLIDNTIVMFTSDHGPWYQGSPGPHRGRKGMTFEGGVRVPFLVSMPSHIEPGVCDSLISATDIFPTLASVAGASTQGLHVDGHNAWRVLTGETVEIKREPLLYFDHWNLQCARWKQWKLHVSRYDYPPYTPFDDDKRINFILPSPELYDLSKDPEESYDVASLHPEVVRDMLHSIDEQLKSFPREVQAARQSTLAHPAPAYAPPGSLPTFEPVNYQEGNVVQQ